MHINRKYVFELNLWCYFQFSSRHFFHLQVFFVLIPEPSEAAFILTQIHNFDLCSVSVAYSWTSQMLAAASLSDHSLLLLIPLMYHIFQSSVWLQVQLLIRKIFLMLLCSSKYSPGCFSGDCLSVRVDWLQRWSFFVKYRKLSPKNLTLYIFLHGNVRYCIPAKVH